MDTVCKRIGVTERCSEEGFYNKVLRKVYKNIGLKVEYVPWNCSEDHSCSSYCYGCEAGDKRGTDITWPVDDVDNNAVILTRCKAKIFILEKNHSVRIRMKKCVGLITSICSNKNITKRLEIKAKVSGHDAKKRLLKYLRTAHLSVLVKYQGSREVKQEGRINCKLNPSDKENHKTGMRRALQITVPAGPIEHPDLTVTSEERILDAILLRVAHTNQLCPEKNILSIQITVIGQLVMEAIEYLDTGMQQGNN
ncbi:hypothetical protein GIB67_003058 [Kingdonia uniflora]|uniref:Glucose-methanol-choline oxidoreductase N-terminal domain-containing protein n=1 Tax=Kingdonia uniflora TaxID=39325 RepID=A0A7J7N639_9MAGN|nr:hypothetical protein GIB67_003058 [Kingdonia uniflora]